MTNETALVRIAPAWVDGEKLKSDRLFPKSNVLFQIWEVVVQFFIGKVTFIDILTRVDDRAITNNQDRDKILATVAATVFEFTKHFPDIPVYATGSTPSRTRLYQIGIAAESQAFLEKHGFPEELLKKR